MKLTMHGATKQVTGSKSILEVNGLKILIDCGLVQTNDFIKDIIENSKPFDFDPSEIDYCIVTHAHIDHSGLIPSLIKNGFDGPILSTVPTMEICKIALIDCAYIWKRELERFNKNKNNRYKNRHYKVNRLTPIYSMEEAETAISCFRGYDYDREIVLNDKVSLYFRNAGHILGAASLEFKITEEIKTKKGYEYKNKTVVFTGDIGGKNDFHPFIKPVEYIDKADYVICESTYGDRKHNKMDPEKILEETIKTTCIDNEKTVLIASFSVQRLQEIIWYLYNVYKEHPEFDKIPIYVDTPMGTKVSLDVYSKSKKFYNQEALDVLDDFGDILRDWDQIKYVATAKQSLALRNGIPKIIIASAGMMQAGRITNHIESFLPSKNCTVMLSGFCAIGTFGRRLQDAYLNEHKTIKSLNGKTLHLRARLVKLEGLSGHADQNDLMKYITHIKGLKKVIINHGERETMNVLKSELSQRIITDILIPNKNQTINLK